MTETATAAADPRTALVEIIIEALDRVATDAETELLTRDEVLARGRWKKDFFYAYVEPRLHHYQDGKHGVLRRYTRQSVDAYIRAHTFTADGHPVHKREARRRSS